VQHFSLKKIFSIGVTSLLMFFLYVCIRFLTKKVFCN